MTRPTNKPLSDRYELSDQLGAGGMAEVYLGRDLVLGRTVAVKTLHTQYAGDDHFIERFRREAQHAAALNHPNIVSVYDTGADDGTYFIVMEYVEGKTLRDVIREEGPLLPERAAEIAADVCAGLAFAHSQGIIHRDVKPANIMITGTGAVKVADFGIARAASGDTVTQTAMVLGTAQYFSPEQAQSGPVDARSDLYSLGIVLYEMLTRQVPFTGSSPVAIAYKHVKEDPVLPSKLNPDVPPDLEAIVMKAMAKNPDNRYQSAQEMREDLQRALHGRPVEATPVLADATGMMDPLSDETVMIERGRMPGAVKPPPTEEERRRRTGLILLGVIVAAIVGVAAWAFIGIVRAPGTVVVPDVVGLDVAKAQERLQAAGLKVEIMQAIFDDKNASGTVSLQSPEKDTRVDEGSTVRLTPSKGTELVPVPNVTGRTEADARKRIEDAGLVVGDVARAASSSVARGRVISQTPSSGVQAKAGSAVDITVSTGPPTTVVPNVVGLLEDDAKVRLENNGLKWQVIEEDQGPDCEQPAGRVCRQDPAEGESVTQGSVVTIYVAKEASPSPTPLLSQCSDGVDNDGDTFVDYPDDPQCTSPTDDDEAA